jgi:NACHT domain
VRRWWDSLRAGIRRGRPLPDSVVLVSVALVLAGVLGSAIKLGDAEVAAPGGWWSRVILIVTGSFLGIAWNVRRSTRAWSSADVTRARTNLLGSVQRQLEAEVQPLTGAPVVPLAVTRQHLGGGGRAAPRHIDVLRDEELLALFADFGPSLVITGRPGSGKSTLAAAVGLALARQAQSDREAPVPVLVELNRLGDGELSALIETTLATEHYLPAPLAQDWLAGAEVLPILDGLDESSLPIDKVIERIERTRRAGAQSVIVCCRSDEYAGASQPLSGSVRAEISDLAPDQITTFLRKVGSDRKSTDAVAERLADLPELQTVLGLRIAASDPTPQGSACSLLSRYVHHMIAARTSRDPQKVEQSLAGIARVMTQAELVPDTLRLHHVRSRVVDRIACVAAVIHGAGFGLLGFGLGRVVDSPFTPWLMATVFAVVGTLAGAVLWDLYDGHRRTSDFAQANANSLESDGLGANTVLGNALAFFAFGVVLLPIGALLGLVLGLVAGSGPLWLVIVECAAALWIAYGAAFSLAHAICVLFERTQWSNASYLGGTRSLRSILVSGILLAVVIWLLVGPWGLERLLPDRAGPWITAGVLGTWLLLLIDLIGQNLLARALLARRTQVPLRLWRFLNDMVGAGVMRPVPRGAAFFHLLYYDCLKNSQPAEADRSS